MSDQPIFIPGAAAYEEIFENSPVCLSDCAPLEAKIIRAFMAEAGHVATQMWRHDGSRGGVEAYYAMAIESVLERYNGGGK